MSITPTPLTGQTPPTPTPTPAPSPTVTNAPNPTPQTSPAPTPHTDGISIDDLAGKIKTKYPEYNAVDNHELVSKVIGKYPEYQTALNTDAIQDLAHRSYKTALDNFLDSPQRKEIDKNLAEGMMFGAGGGQLFVNGMKGALTAGAKPALKMVEHELVDSAGNPLVTNVERTVAGKASDLVRGAANTAYNYVKADKLRAAALVYTAEKLGIGPGKLFHLFHLIE